MAVIILVILLGGRKSKYEKEIIKILKKHGASYYSDKIINHPGGKFSCISIYKPTLITAEKAIAVFTEKTQKFAKQLFPIGIIGICEDQNKEALDSFKNNNNAVITCGANNKNTVTVSSFNNDSFLITLQRTVIDINGKKIEPCEFKIKITEKFMPYSILAGAAVLILNGIIPKEF